MVILNSAFNNVPFSTARNENWIEKMTKVSAWLTMSTSTVLFRIHAWYFKLMLTLFKDFIQYIFPFRTFVFSFLAQFAFALLVIQFIGNAGVIFLFVDLSLIEPINYSVYSAFVPITNLQSTLLVRPTEAEAMKKEKIEKTLKILTLWNATFLLLSIWYDIGFKVQNIFLVFINLLYTYLSRFIYVAIQFEWLLHNPMTRIRRDAIFWNAIVASIIGLFSALSTCLLPLFRAQKHGKAALLKHWNKKTFTTVLLLVISIGIMLSSIGLYGLLLSRGTFKEKFVSFNVTVPCPVRHKDSTIPLAGYYLEVLNESDPAAFFKVPTLSKADGKLKNLECKAQNFELFLVFCTMCFIRSNVAGPPGILGPTRCACF